MLRRVAAAALFAVDVSAAPAAFGQVIYEPITNQYNTGYGDQHYYYGGSNPAVHQNARSYGVCRPVNFGYATNLHRFDGGNSFGQPSPLYYRPAVYTDCIGGGLSNAANYGWQAVDARNEAYANAPTYFRKADLLASAVPGTDGMYHVPPTAPQMYVVPSTGWPTTYPTTGATTGPSAATMPRRGQVIIIPKRLLDRPLKDFTEKKPLKVALAK
jgi:hypothetical protein